LKEKHLYFRGEPERFDRKRLMKELEDCRRDGFTLELGETRPWLNTVASPVFDLSGSTIGYIVIIGLFSA
jgi:DNA-binding IclR family transcriptional regulator